MRIVSSCFAASLLSFVASGCDPADHFEPESPDHEFRSGQNTWSTVDMTCFPPPPAPGEEPGIGSAPPCLLPVGTPDEFVSPSPSGTAKFKSVDGTTKVVIKLSGLEPGAVVTAWHSYFFPGPPGSPVPDPIFAPIDPSDPSSPTVAGVSAPLVRTDAAFTNGRGAEPNSIVIGPGGKGKLRVKLDYDMFASGEGPLRNTLSTVVQADAPAGSDAEQPPCCPDGIPAARPQPIASAMLRAFDPATGFQRLDAEGRPELLRSPVPTAFIAIVVHTDRTTHGVNPGIPILPIPGIPFTTGDHFLLGLFDVRHLQ